MKNQQAKQFNPAEFAKTLERIRAGTDGPGKAQPGFDPKQAAELRAIAANGRKVADYRPALEATGFRYVPAERLPRYSDGNRQTEGLWRNERMRLAFTDGEVVTMFLSPEDFVVWVEKLRTRNRMARAGLHAPK